MLPVIALVGRPNVGKSTLFNVLTGTRDAIVADVPGLTRDRQYGFGRVGPVPCVVIDTGGLVENPSGIEAQMRAQTERAVAEADRLLLLADGRAGFAPQEVAEADTGAIRIAVIGRPNVGKSTLVNRLLGEERVIASEEPGTTRDSILVPFERDGRAFLLIDTAGLRRRARVADAVERVSVAKTLQAIDEAHVVILVLDAHDTVAEQDASVLGLALERGRALVIAVNKWDGILAEQRAEIQRQLALKLDFAPFAPLHFISARHGSGVGELVASTVRAYEAAMRSMPTKELTRTLEHALGVHQPPLVRGRRIKLRYAHQGGRNPPRIVIHGNQTASVPDAYTRYLANVFRKTYDLFATPVVIEYRTDANPYDRERRAKPRPGRPRRRAREKQRR